MTPTNRSSENDSSETEYRSADESDGSPGQYPGVRNQTLNQLIFLKRRLVIGFINETHGTDNGTWWMAVGEEANPESEWDERDFREYLHEHVTAADVQEILETYEGCAGKRKAYDYLNTLRAIEPGQ